MSSASLSIGEIEAAEAEIIEDTSAEEPVAEPEEAPELGVVR